MKTIVKSIALTILLCITAISCEKGGLGGSSASKIKETWKAENGVATVINGQSITLPPNNEVWVWVKESSINSLFAHDDVTIYGFRTNDIEYKAQSYKLYKDGDLYVASIKFDSSTPLTEIQDFCVVLYTTETTAFTGNYLSFTEIKKISFPESVSWVWLRNLDELEYAYFGNNLRYIYMSDLPSLKEVYIPTIPNVIDDEGFSTTECGRLSLNCPNLEKLDIPNNWSHWYVASDKLTSIKVGACEVYEFGEIIGAGCSGEIECPNLTQIEFSGQPTDLDITIASDELTELTTPNTVKSFKGDIRGRKVSQISFSESINYASLEATCPTLTSIELPEGVEGIYISVEESSISEITIPSTAHRLSLFINSTGSPRLNIYCKPTTPPSAGISTVGYDHATLYVPSDSYNAYLYSDIFNFDEQTLDIKPYNF